MGVWGWTLIADGVTLEGKAQRFAVSTEGAAPDGDWSLFVEPGPQHQRLLFNSNGHKNQDGLIECEIRVRDLPFGDRASMARRFFGGLNGKPVTVAGTWVSDDSHSAYGDSCTFGCADRGKTEIHPVDSVFAEHGPSPAVNLRRFEFLVFSQSRPRNRPPNPAELPMVLHTWENRTGTFRVNCSSKVRVRVSEEHDLAKSKRFEIVYIGNDRFQFVGTVESGTELENLGFYHAVLDLVVVREVGDLLHLAGVTDDGRLWHTLRAPDGAWHQFINVEDVAGEGGHLVDVDLRHVGRDVHLCAVSSTGQLWHTVRRADGSWLPFGDVKSQAGDRGQVANVGIAEVSGELHVCAAAGDGRLWHTVRRADGSWLPFGDVEGPAGERGTFRGVDCAGIADGLHVAGVTADGRSWHSLRKGDGSWTGFGDIEAQSGEIGTVTDVACASVTGELHVACVTDDGTVWHTVRRQDGRWTRFGTPQGMTGRPGAFARVGVGESGGVLHLAGTTRDGRLWHTIRRADGSWLPFGDVEGEAGERGRFTALSADGLFVPENPECVQIRADLASIRGRIRELEAEKDDLNPRTNGPQIRLINEQIAQLNQRASQLRERAWRIDCPV